jgi:hypothetical protein
MVFMLDPQHTARVKLSDVIALYNIAPAIAKGDEHGGE